MPIGIIPPFAHNVLPYAIILLGDTQQPYIHIHDQHSLFRAHCPHDSNNRQDHAGHAEELPLDVRAAPGRIGKDNPAGIFKTPRGERRLKEKRLTIRIMRKGLRRRIVPGPYLRQPQTSTTPPYGQRRIKKNSEGGRGLQKVGIITISAPAAMSSRNASGNAKSQQISSPTFPTGVSKTGCGSAPEEMRYGRSGCQMFFLR